MSKLDGKEITSDEIISFGIINFDYKNMDTRKAHHYSDEELLRAINCVHMVQCGGYGLVAELCKRFELSLKD